MIDPIVDMVRQGGWVLVFIAGVSIVAWSLIIVEWLRITNYTSGGWTPIEQAITDLERGAALNRKAIRSTGDNFVGQLLRSEMVERRIDRRSFEAEIIPLLKREVVMLERPHELVNVLAAAMPLLGLLGTVLGMIQTFGALTVRGVAEVDSMAGGISQALITTQAGLVIAVPILLINGLLGARIRAYLNKSSVLIKKIETAICYEAENAA